MLKSVGAGGHYPTNKLQSEDQKEAAQPSTMLAMLADNLMGRAQALAETVLLVFYKVRAWLSCSSPPRMLFVNVLLQWGWEGGGGPRQKLCQGFNLSYAFCLLVVNRPPARWGGGGEGGNELACFFGSRRWHVTWLKGWYSAPQIWVWLCRFWGCRRAERPHLHRK